MSFFETECRFRLPILSSARGQLGVYQALLQERLGRRGAEGEEACGTSAGPVNERGIIILSSLLRL